MENNPFNGVIKGYTIYIVGNLLTDVIDITFLRGRGLLYEESIKYYSCNHYGVAAYL